MKKINIGIVAHVDAGKTTLTEHLLYNGGVIKTIGRVDSGNTQTDSMELERKRGISIKASTTSLSWGDVKINIIDTPGHVDFISEVERSLCILDGAILVISAKEGVQSQTRVLFETLKGLKIPTILFVNKVDRIGADCKKLELELRRILSQRILPLHRVYNQGCKEAYLGELYGEEVIENDIVNLLSELDDGFLENYLKGVNFTKEEIEERLSWHSKNSELYPVIYGSALLGLGVKNLLDIIPKYLPLSSGDSSKELSGVVFKVERSNANQKKTYVRLFEGRISLRDIIKVEGKNIEQKATRIKVIKDGKQLEQRTIGAGDIGVVYGLEDLRIGDTIGIGCNGIKSISISKPILKARIFPLYQEDNIRLYKALTLMAEEDPLLQLEVDELHNSIYINLFGYVQMEIIRSVLEDSYGIEAKFSDPITIYKEAAKGVGTSTISMRQRMNPFAATIGLRVEPLERGEGFVYVSEVSTGSLPKSFQNGIEEGVLRTRKEGLWGWELTDTKVTLFFGQFSSVESTPADFRNLSPMVFMEALDQARTDLLEPLFHFELIVPKNVSGRAVLDLQKMRAGFMDQQIRGEEFYAKGLIPIDTSKNYRSKIAAYTEGKGVFLTRFHGYQIDESKTKKTREKTMADPLNKKEYLLYKLNTVRV